MYLLCIVDYMKSKIIQKIQKFSNKPKKAKKAKLSPKKVKFAKKVKICQKIPKSDHGLIGGTKIGPR
jgi:hypothetical protein